MDRTRYLEWHEPHAAEAALKANPGGALFYAIWNEWVEGDDCLATERGGRSSGVAEVSCNSDAVVRRTMELGDLYVTTPTGGDSDGGGIEPPGQGGGGGKPDAPPGQDEDGPGNSENAPARQPPLIERRPFHGYLRSPVPP